MRPNKRIKDQTDRGWDLEELWRDLGETPPGSITSLDPIPRNGTSDQRKADKARPAAAASLS